MMTRRQFLVSLLPASLLQQPPYTNPPSTVAPHIDEFYQEFSLFKFVTASWIGALRKEVERLRREVPGRDVRPHGGNV